MPNPLPLITKSQITFQSLEKSARLKQPVSSLVQASYSTVLTLASFMLYHYPTLIPPNFPELQLQGNAIDAQYPQGHLTYNRLYEPWCDYLSELFLQNKVSQNHDVCHMYGQVTDQFIDKLGIDLFQIQQRTQLPTTKSSAQQQDQSGNSAKEGQNEHQNTDGKPKKKKIAIINFALSQLRTDFVKPKMHLIGLFTGIFFNQGDQWSTYNVLQKDYPTVEEYKQIDTVILSGSSLSVNDQTPEVVDFVQTLKQAVRYNPNIKILGICFGHQTLAKMFGGKIVQKKLLTGIQKIDFDQNLIHSTPYFRRSELGETTFQLSEYHKDFVVQIPKNFNILAKSQTCKIQSLISKDMKYLSFQFHPQYSAEYIKSFEMRLQHYQIFDLKSAYSHTERGSIKHDSSLWEIRKIIRNFIDWEVSQHDSL